MNRFYMIWNPGNQNPTKQHFDEGQARTEAERLARLNPGQKFYLLAAIDYCQKRDVLWAEDHREMPYFGVEGDEALESHPYRSRHPVADFLAGIY